MVHVTISQVSQYQLHLHAWNYWYLDRQLICLHSLLEWCQMLHEPALARTVSSVANPYDAHVGIASSVELVYVILLLLPQLAEVHVQWDVWDESASVWVLQLLHELWAFSWKITSLLIMILLFTLSQSRRLYFQYFIQETHSLLLEFNLLWSWMCA